MCPKIAGLDAAYLGKQIKVYRVGEKGLRHEPSMYAIVSELSDQDIVELSLYFASQTMFSGVTAVDKKALGEKSYRGGNLACMSCHTSTGAVLQSAGIPRLSDQHATYIANQLSQYKTDKRKTDQNGMMSDIAKRLTEQEIISVSEDVSGLH